MRTSLCATATRFLLLLAVLVPASLACGGATTDEGNAGIDGAADGPGATEEAGVVPNGPVGAEAGASESGAGFEGGDAIASGDAVALDAASEGDAALVTCPRHAPPEGSTCAGTGSCTYAPGNPMGDGLLCTCSPSTRGSMWHCVGI